MQRKNYLLSGLIALFLLFGLIAPQAAEARDIIVNAGEAQLYLDPFGVQTITNDATQTLKVMVDDVVNLTAYHLELTYDPEDITITAVRNGVVLASPTEAGLFEPTNWQPADDTGVIKFGMAQQGTGGNPSPVTLTEPGVLLEVDFTIDNQGTTTLALDGSKSVLVSWPDAFVIDFSVPTGQGSVTYSLDNIAPTIVSGVAHGVAPYEDVNAVGMTFTVPQGYVVSTIDFTMSEPVTVVAGTEVTLAGAPYGLVTVSADGLTLTVTPYPGNEIANLLGEFIFSVPAGSIKDLAGNALATLSAKMIVTDQTAPTIVSGVAHGVTPYEDVNADGMIFTVPQGYEVSTIDFTMSEPVTVVAGTEVTLAGAPYGLVTVSSDGLTLTVTPYAGNEIANLLGEFIFSVPAGSIKDLAGNPLATLEATMIVTDQTAPTVVSGVAKGVAPYTNVTADSTLTFTVPQGYVVSTIDFTMSEAVEIVAPGIVYMEGNPYGTMVAAGDVVTVTPYSGNEIANLLGEFIFSVPAGSIKDLVGNPLATLSATMVVTDQTDPVMTMVTPAEGLITLGLDDTFILTVDAFDLNLYSLEVDHSFEGALPEFTVYASAANPWGSPEAKAGFDYFGMTVAYDETAQKWTIDFGETVTDTFIPSGVTFYMVLKDEAGNTWGSMSPTTVDNTYAYTFEVTNTLEPEITSAVTYAYTPVYNYVGDVVFDDPNNIFTATYSPAEFLAGGAMNDLARYLGALNYQETSTIISIVYDGVTYTWNPAEPNTGSNWYNGTTSLVSAMVADYQAAPGDLVITVGDGWHTSNVTFRLLITNTLDDEIESAPSYVYSDYTYVGDYAFVDATNIYTVTYDDVEFNPNAMYDLARYLGALNRQDDATVTSIVFGGVTYTWDPAGTLQGSNWVDAEGNTLVSAVVAGIGSYDPAVGLVFTVGDGIHTETVIFKFVITDTTAPTIVSGEAIGASGFAPVPATGGLTFTVPQGYTVDHIEITMSEAVQIVAPGIVYIEGNAYGTMSASGNVVTITPYAGNEVANMPGTFDFSIDAGSVKDLAGNDLTTLTATMVVEPSLIFDITDFGPYPYLGPGAYSLGWGYVPQFDTTTIASIEVGMLDAARESIVTYTADDEQIVWQLANGWIPTPPANLSSAPFYRVYNGNPIAEGEDLDWTVIFGSAFDSWSPKWGYVKVTDIYGTVVYHEREYTGTLGDLTAPTIGEAVAIGVDPYDDVTAENLTFTVPQGYVVSTIDFTMSEPVTVVAGTEVTLAGLPYGLVTVSADGLTLTVTPYPGNTVANLIGPFTFNVADGKIFDLSGNPLGTLAATLVVTNVAPVAANDAYTVAEDGVLTVAARGVLINDTDFDPTILTAALVTGPSNGTVVLNANGSFTYTPAANFHGTDTFTYKANDGLIDSAVATVTITVTSVNDAPVLAPIGAQTVDNTATLTITPSASDADGDPLTWSLGAGAPTGATIDPTTGAFSWAPGTSTTPGSYSATICVSDGTTQDCETVTIIVTDGQAPVLTSVTPPEGDVYLAAGEHFVLTVDALDDNLRELEIDHSMQGALPEFSVYASESDPYGGDGADFALLGVSVTYDAATQTWVIDFGASVTEDFITNGGITFYLVLKDEAGNQWGTMYGTTAENTFAYNLILDDVAPDMEEVAPPEGDVYLAGGENFVLTVDALDTNLYSLEIDHSMEASLPEFTLYADAANPYGSAEAKTAFEAQGVLVTYDSVAQVWTIDFGATITNAFITNGGITFYMVLEDMAGNTWGSMYTVTPENTYEYNLIRDDVDPVMEAVLPVEGALLFGPTDTFVLTVDALDTNLYSLEIDHSMEASLPEFTLYADAGNPYGSAEAKEAFEAQGVSVTYDDVNQIWTIDFGSAVTDAFIGNGGITFYMVLKDAAGNTWGSMSPTTGDNTYIYTITVDDTAPVLESWLPAEGDILLAGGEDFVLTIDALDTNLYSLEIDHSLEGTLPEFSVYANAAAPWGTTTDLAGFTAAGVEIAYDADEQVWTITFKSGGAALNAIMANNGITFYAVLEDLVGNSWGSMYTVTPENTFVYNIELDDTAPVLVSVTPPHDSTILLGIGDTFKLTIVADGDNLRELEIDHSMQGALPEFSVYASESDPYGGDGAAFLAMGVSVTYDASTQTWVIDFGPTVSGQIANNGGITFYLVLEDMAGNTWGSMSPTTPANTFKYTVSQDLAVPTIGSGVAKSASDGNVNLVDGKFTVPQGYVVDSIDITMNEPVLVEIGTVITMVGYGPYGTITANVGGVITITPYPGNEIAAVIGLFSFTLPDGAITDLSGNPFTGSIGLEVLNVAPVAANDAYTVAEDGVLTVAARGVLINDTDFDPSILTAVKATDPAHGTLTLNADGSFTYTPAANFHGTDTFTYKANDGLIDSAVATVTITVTSVLDAPTVSSTNLPGPYSTGLNQAFEVTLTNPAYGDAFTNVLARFRLEGITLADIASFQYLETSLEPDQWLPLPLVQDGTGVVGNFGPATGFPMTAPYSATSQFKVTFNTAGTYPASIVLYDVAADPDVVLDTYTSDVVVVDESAPVVSIIEATADGDTMAGTLEEGYILEITNDPAADDHLLQIDATVNEPLEPKYNGLYFVESESTVTAAQLKAYYDARGVPSTPLDFLGYLKGAADGLNPFVFIKEDALSLSLVDAAKHTLMSEDVDMTIPDNFPVGKYVVRGVVEDADGNETTVTLILIIRWTEETALEWLQDNTVLSSVSMMVADLKATFPASIPPVIVEKDYVIDSRMTLAAPLPAGSTVTVFKDGVQILTDITLNGTGPFWFTELFDPDAPRAGFNANYGGKVEDYSIIVTGPAGLAADFDTTVFIESVISKDNYTTETVLDDITLGIHLDDAVAPAIGTGVAKSASDGNVNLVDGKFTVPQGYVVDTIDITMNEPVLVEIGTVITMIGYGPYGTITANVGGVITITPYPGNEIAAVIGLFSFTLPDGAITDLSGNPFTGSIGLEVVNVAPVAVDDAYTVAEDGVLTVAARGVLINDTDFDPSILTAVKVTDPAHGTLTLNADGSFTYTPAANFHGTDSFTYKANDGLADSNVATVTITVTEVNDAPVAQNQSVTTPEDTAKDITLVASDVDGETLTYVIVAQPAHGTVNLVDNVATYTPTLNYVGPDSFTFKVNDGMVDSNVATVTITVTPVNDAPMAVDDDYEMDEDGVLTVVVPGVLENDTDVDLDNMVVALVSSVSHGELVLLGDGSFTYTPEPDFYGEDSFVYELVTYPAIQAGWTDEATVTITVRPINDAPVAQDQTVTTPEETAKAITLVATDVDGDTLTYAIVAQPAHGSVNLVGNVATYTPAVNYTGPDSFTFKANDSTVDSNVATVTITVTPVNDAPVAVDDAYTVAEKEILTIAAPGVLGNDTDVDGDTLSAILVDTVQNGTLSLNADGSFVYTPNEYFNGTDSFTYKAKDATLESEMAVVTITVTPVNDWPIANDDSYETVTGVLLDVAAPGVLENDVLLDPDEVVSILILDEPQHGTLSMNNDGSFTYTPDAGFMGTDTFRYQLNSVQLHAEWSDDALVTIVVKPYMGLFLPIIWR